MNLGDLNNVWEIKALKRKPREEEARKILDRVAKQVQPIMVRHHWRVKVLSEFCPKNRSLLGLNVGGGIHVKLRLRRVNNDEEFLPFHEVLDTMLHELCHNAHGTHNASFYKLWDDIRRECEDLISNGITGSGQGFDIPGKRLGGFTSKPPLSSLRKTVLTAAENRARLGKLLPSGPRRVGGDNSIMVALSPVQAAAMAAERRLQDNIWCGSELCDDSTDDEVACSFPESDKRCCSEISKTASGEHNMRVESQKRNRESDDVSLWRSGRLSQEPIFVDLTKDVPESASTINPDETHLNKIRREDLSGEASIPSSIQRHIPTYEDNPGTWQCSTCTLLNPRLAPISELCRAEQPKDGKQKIPTRSCRFCTLENDEKIDRCSVCEAWRYSYGQPVELSLHPIVALNLRPIFLG